METNQYRFNLSFRGELVEHSVDAFDVANTILATAQALREIAEIKYGREAKSLSINIDAFKEGSLMSGFLITAKDIGLVALPAIGGAFTAGKEILETYVAFIQVKKALKGEKAKSIKPAGDGIHFNIVANDNANITVNLDTLRALQNKTVNKCAAKAVQPLNKEGSELDEISIIPEGGGDEMTVSKEEAQYVSTTEDQQVVESIKYKGVVSKIDRKTRSGFLDFGANKRLSFYYDSNLPKHKFALMVKSLEDEIQIFLIGSVTMDYENNPTQLTVADVESEIKLFD